MLPNNSPFKNSSAFFEAVRAGAAKVTGGGKLNLREINERINELLKASIKSEGVINVFVKAKEFSLFDEEYLKMIQEMKQKNLAVEMLRKLLGDEIKAYTRSNAIKAELFSEKMKKLMNQYRNGLITNAEVIEQLIKMAVEMRDAKEAGNDLGLPPQPGKPCGFSALIERDFALETVYILCIPIFNPKSILIPPNSNHVIKIILNCD